jgi:PAS domain S-box-containing protein
VDSWVSGVHPDDWPRVQKALSDHFQGIASEYETEHRVLTKSGEWMWILDRGKVVTHDASGQPLRMAGTELDITGRKRLEQQLRLSEAKSSGILDISADAIVSIDEDQRITLFNKGAEQIFGYSAAEAIGAPLDILIPERLRAIHREHVKRFAAGPASSRRMGDRSTTILGRRQGGEEFFAEAAVSKLDIAGSLVMTVALRDISEQKRIEREQTFLAEVGAVLASTLDFEDTLENIGRLAVRDLADFCTVDVVEEGGRIRRLKVVSREPAKQWICDLFTHLPFDERVPYLLKPVIESKQPLLVERPSNETICSLPTNEQELRALRAAGFKSMVAVPMLARGRLVGILALVASSTSHSYGPTDIRLAEELAQRAAFSIENTRFFGEAQRAVKTREDVLAIVSHDLKNPLSTIGLAAQVLRQFDQADATVNRVVGTIQRAVDRMQVLIADLLDFARMQSRTFSITASAENFNRVAMPVLDGLKLLAENKQQAFAVNISPNLPEVVVDRDRIAQVLSNLVGNAIKFTPHGGSVRVSARQQGNEIVLCVEDNGPGIPAEQLPRVFDWLWQAREHRQMGSGLGLSIVQGIVKAHGGRVWAESQLGKGSSFSFTLPLAGSVGRTDDAA